MLAAVLLLTGCGGTTPRGRIETFINAANGVIARAAPAINQANARYAQFSKGKLSPRAAVTAMRANGQVVAAMRAEILALPVPPQARRLQALFVAVFNADERLARQSTVMATYLPAVRAIDNRLAAGGRALQRGLTQATPAQQAHALALYAGGLGGALKALRRLHPPLILGPSHRAQLRQIAAARGLARRLRSAILALDTPTVTRLLGQFHRVNARRPPVALTKAAFRQYEALVAAVARAQLAVQTEEARLSRTLH